MQRRRREARDDTLSMRPQPSRLGSLMQRWNGVFLQVYVWEDREVPRPQFMLANRSGDYCLTADERRVEPCHGSNLARSPRRVCLQIAFCGRNAICEQFRGMDPSARRKPPACRGLSSWRVVNRFARWTADA